LRRRTIALLSLLLILTLAASACGGAEPTATPPLPTDTAVVASDTPLPPTATPLPATETPLPPTDTPAPVAPTPTQIATLELGAEQYRNGANGFAIAYPQGWEQYAFTDDSRILFHAGTQPVEEIFGGNVSLKDPIVVVTGGPVDKIYDGQLQGAETTLDILDILLSWLSDYESFKAEEPQTLTVSGQEAIAVDVIWTQEDVAMAGRDVVIQDGDRIIAIQAVGTAEDWQTFRPTFEAMVDSLVLFAPDLSQYVLTETHQGQGYAIGYPTDWQVRSTGDVTVIFESQAVLQEEAPSVPVVQIDAGPLERILDGIAAQATNATEMLEAVGETKRAEGAELQMGGIQEITGGDEPGAAVSITWLENDVATMDLAFALQRGDWGIVIQAVGTLEGWQDFAPIYGEMIESLALDEPQTTGEIDWTDPASVLQAVFTAAQTEDFSRLPELCDPLGEHDGDTDAICNMAADHPDRDAFVAAFAQAQLNGDPLIDGDRAEVPFLYGPNGDQEETMTLIRRDGKWYLLGF